MAFFGDLVLSDAIEFISSQSPYSMKGLLIGFTYIIIWVICPVHHSVAACCLFFSLENWPYGCGVWFYPCVYIYLLSTTTVTMSSSMMMETDVIYQLKCSSRLYYDTRVQYRYILTPSQRLESAMSHHCMTYYGMLAQVKFSSAQLA